jgi:hypothetical protein
MDRFAAACHELWNREPLQGPDLVFLPSVTEFDLLGLVRFLQQRPETAAVDWHLLFHFNPFLGRTPDYAAQEETRDRFRRLFSAALGHLPQHRLHFYGVTDLLADQYNRLGAVPFAQLPYTLNEKIRVTPAPGGARARRLTCPGVIRREKGKRQIRALVRQLWADHLLDGQYQLVFQGRPQDRFRFFPRETYQHSEFCERPGGPSVAPIVIVRHPLHEVDYARFIRESQVGLFLHDAERYFARCSGTLVELLGAGVPVIVPAGCWLSEQVSEPIYEHLDQLVAGAGVVDAVSDSALRWDLPRVAGHTACRPAALGGLEPLCPGQCETPVPLPAAQLVCSLTLAGAATPGHYVRVTVRQRDARGRLLPGRQAAVLGVRGAQRAASALFHLHERAASVRLRIRNAYGTWPVSVSALRVTFLEANTGPAGPTFPGGKVGLIAADLSEVSRLLSDLSIHYQHYRRSAIEFARQWAERHSAAAVIQTLAAQVPAGAPRHIAA